MHVHYEFRGHFDVNQNLICLMLLVKFRMRFYEYNECLVLYTRIVIQTRKLMISLCTVSICMYLILRYELDMLMVFACVKSAELYNYRSSEPGWPR